MEREKEVRHSDIFRYWRDKEITPQGKVSEVSDIDKDAVSVVYDCGEPRCWACGEVIEDVYARSDYEEVLNTDVAKIWDFKEVRSKLNRCHIVPKSAGGKNEPGNLFLMCENCHLESPDTENEQNFMIWVYKKRKSGIRVNGFSVDKIFRDFIELCKIKNKNPTTCDFNNAAAKIFSHGGKVSQYTIPSAMSDACKNF